MQFFSVITGVMNAVFLSLLLLKGPIRKYGKQEWNAVFMKLHKPCSAVLCLTMPIHLCLVLSSMSAYSFLHNSTGILLIVMYFLLVTLCHTMKNQMNKMRVHRILSVCLFCLMLVHILAH